MSRGKMRDDSLPLFRASSVIYPRKTVFHTLSDRVTVEVPQALMRCLIDHCDGTRLYPQVIEEVTEIWDKDSTVTLIDSLFQSGVIFDARMLNKEVWRAIENPSRFPVKASNDEVNELMRQAMVRHRSDEQICIHEPEDNSLARLLKQRRSVRSFSGQPVDFESIVSMLWSGYGEFEVNGISHRTSPSAGALYPIMVHMALFTKTGVLDPGVYSICYDRHGRVGFKLLSVDVDRVRRSFLDPRVLTGTNGLIVLSGSFDFSNKKYGNRSMLYVPLEAGHVAQNILISASERGVATLEIGGFVDQLLFEALELPKTHCALTTIAFGQEDKTLHKAEDAIQIDWAVPMSGQFRPPFIIASAKMAEKGEWSSGRDASPVMALTKAIAETREWAACGSIPPLLTASYDELESAIDPRSVVRFHPRQYQTKNFPFAPFDPKAQYAWTLGRDYSSGKQVHVLADHVYFPYFPKTPYYCFSNSSGCAAHPDEIRAIETATLELIERDAFMLAHLTRLSYPAVREETLPVDLQGRIANLRAVGFDVWIKDHSLDLAPVVMVFVQSKDLAYTKCASCSSFDLHRAVSHALSEVEASVLFRLQNGKPRTIGPNEVGSPLEHGRLYACESHYQSADFLVEGASEIAFKEIGSGAVHTWHNLLQRLHQKDLHLFTIPLDLSGDCASGTDLHVVRAIVPGLVPMTFGNRQEPAGMERVYQVAKEFGNKELSYRELTKFPHPFE